MKVHFGGIVMRLRIAILCASLCAASADAGAWLREQGTGFAATSTGVTDQFNAQNGFYLEYGLTAGTTVGLDIDMRLTQAGQSGSGHVFARRALPFGGKGVWAYQIGLGAAFQDVAVTPLAKLGLSYGRGIKLGKYDGWLAVDSAAQWDFGTSVRSLKVDTTAGLTFNEHSKAMVQLFWTADSLGTSSATLTPSYVYTPERGRFSYVVGVEAIRGRSERYGIKLGLWSDF
ncbi:hypothetical protein [Pseudosulfitobacter koreensis]|uniref:Outer membrane protein beta-barrel domain-containing protein n=1 Tax=Pseudosulfitobacter koreensis TaxID=2968472 RepID=A0ABT1Z3G5_9RHOB|nr:hypothetical protein [Pseudosulfitobacter koreense]MCR8827663.1 hypothetical protein [Pseudosulfitobacter koreense]